MSGWHARRRGHGFTLIELMVSLTIGAFLVIAAVQILMLGRTTLAIAERVARMQETARFALAVLEPELRMAGYWGLARDARMIAGRATAARPSGIGVAADCGDDWAVDLEVVVGGTNNGYGWQCRPYAGRAARGSDTLVIRRAGVEPSAGGDAGRLYVQTYLAGHGELVVGPVPPRAEPPAGLAKTSELVVLGYYVSETSSLSTSKSTIPSLRVKRLSVRSGVARMVDEEVAPGIEDMQVELGIDFDSPGAPGHGVVDEFTPPDDPRLSPSDPAFEPDARVIAVRIWLRIRAESRENGFVDDRTYDYSDLEPFAPADAFRRYVVSATLAVRNSRNGS